MVTMQTNLPMQLTTEHDADVLVVGGGPGGIGAAVAAARGGAKVLLVEHYGFLGGMATAGEVNPFMPNHHGGKSLDTGIFEEWFDRMATYGATRSGRVFDPNVARLAAEDLCLEAGVKLLYHHRSVTADVQERKIRGVVLHSKHGLSGAVAKVYIDATGDGDLAVAAGCRANYGSEDSGHAQPMTLCFKLKIDRADLPEEFKDKPVMQAVWACGEQIQKVYKMAQADGRTENPREDVLMFPSVDPDVVHFNSTRVIHRKAIDGRDLSDAEVQARRQLRQLWKLLATEIPIFRNSRLHSIAPQIGVRETRHIVGRYTVTLDDYRAGKTFPDAVARVTYGVDIHNPNGSGTTFIKLPKDAWYEIPWRALLPADVDNLVIASRAISADHATHSSFRVMPPVVSVGQAAGTAAAIAVRGNMDVSAVDGVALNRRLVELGRNLVAYDPTRTWGEAQEVKKSISA